MADITLATLMKYAEQHFPEDFAKLPTVTSYIDPKDTYRSRCIMRIDADEEVSMTPAGYLYYDEDAVKTHEPFCWIVTSDESDTDSKLNAFLRFCFMSHGYNGYSSRFRGDFLLQFKLACADITGGMQAKDVFVNNSSDWSARSAVEPHVPSVENKLIYIPDFSNIAQLHDRIEELITAFDALKAKIATDQTALEQVVNVSEAKTRDLEQQFTSFKIETQMAMDDVSKDNVDWMKQFAAGKIELERLTAKLIKAQAEIVTLQQENKELRNKLSGQNETKHVAHSDRLHGTDRHI